MIKIIFFGFEFQILDKIPILTFDFLKIEFKAKRNSNVTQQTVMRLMTTNDKRHTS